MFSIQFLLTSLIVVLIPGTGVIYTISTGIVHKKIKSIYAAIGCTLGIVPHLIACILGLSAIMNMSAQIFVIIKMLGSIYLFYLAIKTWIYAEKSQLFNDKKNYKNIDIIKKGIILNPKLTIFFLSFLPQFIPGNSANVTFSMLILSFVFMIMTLFVFILYGIFASFISEVIVKSNKIITNIEKGFAIIFAGLAIDLAISKK